jgi:hypothetical protein
MIINGNQMRLNSFSIAAFLLTVFAYHAGAQATPLINNTGLVSPVQTLTFSEVSLPSESPVTDEYAGFGVTFSPGLFYNTQPDFFPTESLANFVSVFGGQVNNPVSILFSQDLTEVAFALQTNLGITTFTALLDSIVVESFTAETTLSVLPDTSQASNFYGFTNITLDEIRISPDTPYFQVDNLQVSVSSIPEPGTLCLLGLGFAGIFLSRRRARVQ